VYREKAFKNISSEVDLSFHGRLASLIGKNIKIHFEDGILEGKLLAFDKQHCNLCILVNGKLLFVRGNSYLYFSEV